MQTIKSIARRLQWADQPKTHNTYFYEPLTEQAAIDKAVAWALANPQVFLITAGDMAVLPKSSGGSGAFATDDPTDAEMQALVETYDIQPVFT